MLYQFSLIKSANELLIFFKDNFILGITFLAITILLNSCPDSTTSYFFVSSLKTNRGIKGNWILPLVHHEYIFTNAVSVNMGVSNLRTSKGLYNFVFGLIKF